MDINYTLKKIYDFKNLSRRLFYAIFDKPRQWFVVFLGVCILFIGSFFASKDSGWLKGFGLISIGIGGSVLASGLVVNILSRIPREAEGELFIQTGIAFVGDRDAFNEEYHVGNQKGWDAWIRQTPRGGHLIISGKEQRYWLEKSLPAVQSVLQKHIQTNFVFLGDEEQVQKYRQNFMLRFDEKVGDQPELTKHLKCWKYVPDESHKDVDDFGFYWNGSVLLVKMYLHDIPKEYCPIIGFKIPGTVSIKFNIEDFHEPATLILSHASALKKCVESLNHIWAEKKGFKS